MKKKKAAHPETLLLLRCITRASACHAAKKWVRQNQEFSPRELYNACERADWLVFIACALGFPVPREITESGDLFIFAGDGAVGSRRDWREMSSRETTTRVHELCVRKIKRAFPYKDLRTALVMRAR